ncbi:ABC-type sugar transport system protein [Bifidobacterium pullorum subsp. saeculare DSM 6531 = LMG 14934]|uniref:ABC-type sugar transport system protein n=1 Tax=Bifidobacterium pullorum subsp. saeculare DSM 6531 = LMG 14934 TaxID=1437611 RepID=A0A087CQF9_9BIFI|nr:ATP-binding cassette domain-containing protein [Bifidobacterium pullorum]KFI85509.1 ABC-type sugar transport system protein [Bifidobacterium pullorum subsp. saeculare DSM 6531 = LMG 14934]
MTDKELKDKDMDETTSMDTTAAAESAAEAVDVNEAVDDALLSDVDELAFDVDFDDDDADDDVTDVATDVIGTDDGDRDGNVDNSNVVDEDTDDVDDETTKVDTASAPAPADGGADVVAANADHVNAMLSLATPRESTDDESSPDYIETPRSASSATAVSTHIDREVKVGDEDLNLLRAYPTLSLHDVTYRDRKTGRAPVEHLTCAFEAGTVSAILVPDGDDMARTAMVGLLSGLLMPESGHLMNRSAEYLSIEPFELRGHRIGLVPQRFAVRGDLSPVRNLVYAMDASNRNFLKPKPVLARELLLASGLDETLLDNRVDSLNEVDRRRVAIARAVCCEAEIMVLDEPLDGLEDGERDTIMELLRGIAHGDPKRCVVVVTQDAAVAESADQTVTL